MATNDPTRSPGRGAWGSGIYCIHNTVSDKVYVGQAVDLRHRRNEHFRKLRKGTHENQHLQNAWNKYGARAFVFIVLERCRPEELTAREQHWMNYYQSANGEY